MSYARTRASYYGRSILLTAYKNAGGDIELKDALFRNVQKGERIFQEEYVDTGVPVGAGISAGIFVSIVTGFKSSG